MTHEEVKEIKDLLFARLVMPLIWPPEPFDPFRHSPTHYNGPHPIKMRNFACTSQYNGIHWPCMNKDPKKVVMEIANHVGKHDARKLLVDEGISTSTADKLVANRYKNEVGQLIKQAILRAYEVSKRQAS